MQNDDVSMTWDQFEMKAEASGADPAAKDLEEKSDMSEPNEGSSESNEESEPTTDDAPVPILRAGRLREAMEDVFFAGREAVSQLGLAPEVAGAIEQRMKDRYLDALHLLRRYEVAASLRSAK